MSVPEDKLAAAAQGMLHAWWAERIPDRLALVTPHGDRTYEDLNADINRLARALRARGLQAGDSIALMCTNRPEFLEVLYAAQRIGLRFTPINWHLTGDEAAYIVENCEAKAFVCSGELGDKVTVAAEAGGPGLVKINSGGYVPGFEMYNSVVAAEDGSNIDDPVLGTQMLYTSGTTGRPKGVHRDTTVVSTLATVNFCGYDEDYAQSVDAHLVTGPLYHAAPLAFSVAVPFLYGVPLVVMDHWDAVEALRLVERHGITHTHMVPTMFHRLLALPPEERDALRHVVAALRDPRGGTVPGPRQAAPDRVAGTGRGRVLRRHRGPGHPGRLRDLARPSGHRRPAHGARPGQGGRRRGQRPASRRGRPGLPPGAGRPPSSTTTAMPRRRPGPSAATTSPWATWGTWTRRATCSSPTARPT